MLALRSDMTIPIARVVATRYPEQDGPLRLCYFAHAYRAVERGTGQQREFLQGGIELVGVEGGGGRGGGDRADACRRSTRWAWPATGSASATARCTARCCARSSVPEDATAPWWSGCRCETSWGSRWQVDKLGLAKDARELLVRLPELRGGPEVLDSADGPLTAGALDGLRTLYAALEEQGVADRVILDLGLLRMLGYYTGAVYEVYDPAVGFTLGGGGRYDDLIGRFGASRPACGIALDIQRVHIAQAAEEGMG